MYRSIGQITRDCFESPGSAPRVLPMEGLRGLAVLSVFFVHAHAFFGSYLSNFPRLFNLSEYLGRVGNAGVDLFFVLSGFIIYAALIQKPLSYSTFLWRRVKRIYPTFIAVLALYLLLSVIFPAESRLPASAIDRIKYVFENLLLLPGVFRITPIITVAWSLSFEFAFYLCVPLVAFLTARSKDNAHRIAILSLLWIAFVLSEFFVFHGGHIRMLSFISGMLLQEVIASGTLARYLTSKGQWIAIAALIGTASYHFGTGAKTEGQSNSVLSAALMSVAILFFVLYALKFSGTLQKLCTWTPMRYWGNVSYSYYLAHGITLKAIAISVERFLPVHHSLFIYLLAMTFGMVATWVSASLLYVLVEKPISLAPSKRRGIGSVTPVAPFRWWLRRERTAAETLGNS